MHQQGAQNPHAERRAPCRSRYWRRRRSGSDSSEYVATLKSRDSAVIMPQVEGQITQIFVHSGERVEAGTPMRDRSAETAGHR